MRSFLPIFLFFSFSFTLISNVVLSAYPLALNGKIHQCEKKELLDMEQDMEGESKPCEKDGEEKEDTDEKEYYPQLIQHLPLSDIIIHKAAYYLHIVYSVCLKHDYIPPELK